MCLWLRPRHARSCDKPHDPLHECDCKNRDDDSQEGGTRAMPQPPSAKHRTDPAPGNQKDADNGHHRPGWIGPGRVDPRAPHEVREAGGHAATGTGNVEQQTEGARGQSEPLMSAKPSRVGRDQSRQAEAGNQQDSRRYEQPSGRSRQRNINVWIECAGNSKRGRCDIASLQTTQGGLRWTGVDAAASPPNRSCCRTPS